MAAADPCRLQEVLPHRYKWWQMPATESLLLLPPSATHPGPSLGAPLAAIQAYAAAWVPGASLGYLGWLLPLGPHSELAPPGLQRIPMDILQPQARRHATKAPGPPVVPSAGRCLVISITCALEPPETTSFTSAHCCNPVPDPADMVVGGDTQGPQSSCWAWLQPCLLSLSCATGLTSSYPLRLCTCTLPAWSCGWLPLLHAFQRQMLHASFSLLFFKSCVFASTCTQSMHGASRRGLGLSGLLQPHTTDRGLTHGDAYFWQFWSLKHKVRRPSPLLSDTLLLVSSQGQRGELARGGISLVTKSPPKDPVSQCHNTGRRDLHTQTCGGRRRADDSPYLHIETSAGVGLAAVVTGLARRRHTPATSSNKRSSDTTETWQKHIPLSAN